MNVDFLIIGQGISGTMLSYFLKKEGKSFMVIDEGAPNAPSRIAAGMINPVTGRRYATTWMIEEILPFAAQVYEELERELSVRLLYRRSIIEFFTSPQMRESFVSRIEGNGTYLGPFPDQNSFNPFFNYEFGCGEIRGAFNADVPLLVSTWREKLKEDGTIKEERFDFSKLQYEDEVVYDDIEAKAIIFCNGLDAAMLPPFSLLPFSAFKGEILIIRSPNIPRDHVYKRGMLLVPLAEEGYFWYGSNYVYEFENDLPTDAFRQGATTTLKNFLRHPFTVEDHRASVRPATLERRPFVGPHPHYPNLYILDGMGSKGTSLAPFFASQLVQNLVQRLPITPEASLERFSRILSRQSD